MRRQWLHSVFRWGLHVAAAVSLLLCVATAALWARHRERIDILTTTAGPRFFEFTLRPRGMSLQWVWQLPPSSVPPNQSLGWSVGIGGQMTPRGAAFLNVPEQTTRTSSFAGVSVTSGSGQILRPAWIGYRSTTLLPLYGLAIRWPTLLVATTVLPVAWLVVRLTRGPRRGRIDYKSPTFARAIQP